MDLILLLESKDYFGGCNYLHVMHVGRTWTVVSFRVHQNIKGVKTCKQNNELHIKQYLTCHIGPALLAAADRVE